MIQNSHTRTSWFSAALLALGAVLTPLAGAKSTGTTNSGELLVSATGPANCNCTGSEADLTVCHVTDVAIRVGGAAMNVSTGQSESNCGSKTVDDGTCIYYVYNFVCEDVGFIFRRWSCRFVGTGLKQRPARENEC